MPRVTRLLRVVEDGFATSTSGVKISYTAPAQTAAAGGRFGKIVGVSWFNNSGTPTVQCQLLTTAPLTIVLGSGADAPVADWGGTGLILRPGETFQMNVTGTAVGGSTADATLSVEEWSCS